MASISSAVGSSSDCAAGAACGIRATSCACPASVAALAMPPSFLTAGATAVPMAPIPRVPRRPIAPRRVTRPIVSIMMCSLSLSLFMNWGVGISTRDPNRFVEDSALAMLGAKVARRRPVLDRRSAREGGAPPRGTQDRQQPAIEAPVPGDLPAQHQEDGESEEDGVA